MKFLKTFSFVALTAQADERKVPPRQPFQRLLTLEKYTKLWIETRIKEERPNGINRPTRAENMIEKGLGRLVSRMNDVVPVNHQKCVEKTGKKCRWGTPTKVVPERTGKDCFFFNEDFPHGGLVHGPIPNKQRKRRTAWVDREMSRIQREIDESNEPDIFDEYFDSFEKPGTDRSQQEKSLAEYIILQESEKVWRQIGTGFKKFILRYMANCGGEKNYQYHTKRINKIHDSIGDSYKRIKGNQDAEVNDDYELDDEDY